MSLVGSILLYVGILSLLGRKIKWETIDLIEERSYILSCVALYSYQIKELSNLTVVLCVMSGLMLLMK